MNERYKQKDLALTTEPGLLINYSVGVGEGGLAEEAIIRISKTNKDSANSLVEAVFNKDGILDMVTITNSNDHDQPFSRLFGDELKPNENKEVEIFDVTQLGHVTLPSDIKGLLPVLLVGEDGKKKAKNQLERKAVQRKMEEAVREQFSIRFNKSGFIAQNNNIIELPISQKITSYAADE